MSYTVADITDVKERLIALLNANPGVWSASVSGSVGAFPSDNEISAAVFEADSIVCAEGYFGSINSTLSNQFDVTSAPFASNGHLPFHKGTLSNVEVSISTNNFTAGTSNTSTTSSAHGLTTGQLLSVITTGALPTGLTALTNYYAIVVTSTTLKFATSLTNALAGTAVSVTSGSGSGTNTIIAWQTATKAESLDDITDAIAVGEAYVEAGAYDFLYFENEGIMYTPATYWRATYPEYISNGSTLQANQNETTLIVFTAAAILAKNASPAEFEYYNKMSQTGIQQLMTEGRYTEVTQ